MMASHEERRRGSRLLRVAIEISPQGARVDRLWLVDEPATQRQSAFYGVLTRVDIDGEPALVETLPDPRLTRSTASDERGHHYGTTDTGLVIVSVPFDSSAELENVSIRLAEPPRPSAIVDRTLPDMAEMFDEEHALQQLAFVTAEDLMNSPDWSQIEQQLAER